MKTWEKYRLASLTHNYKLPPEVYFSIHKLIIWSKVLISPVFYKLSPMGMAFNNYIRTWVTSNLSVFLVHLYISTICALPGFISRIIGSGEGAIFTWTTVDRKKMAPGTVNHVPVIVRNTATANKKHPGI